MSGQTVKSGRWSVRIPDKNGQFCGHVSGEDRRNVSTDLYGYYPGSCCISRGDLSDCEKTVFDIEALSSFLRLAIQSINLRLRPKR